ncbi:MAG: Fic family protein [Acidimicrobiaceae bacterium]|nr:Fic family protein [Acidimicrobiaceae bacterium]MCY4280099.1 Fic family protein [Acidimicrobiaceae bacterium]MCY4294953.1 Fic family protein [Acidimicrobiaceae bacterium]
MSPQANAFSLEGSPYTIDATGRHVIEDARKLQERADLLRQRGRLTDATLRAYFGDKRYEQIAESNAIEGSTLGVGETELAVEKGVTITGHDPAYSADAVNLSRALAHMVELAKDPSPSDSRQVKELHSLVLGRGPTAGLFRSAPVRISGSPHTPPATWHQVMSGMEEWERWSVDHAESLPLLRAIVLHAWLTHIHPFTDGNGRTARAVMNLELIRAGLPSVIIRRKDRLRYYDALAESDLGGDLEPLSELILARAEDALRDLERAAKRHEGYDAAQEMLRKAQARRAAIWNDAVSLLFSLVTDAIESAVGDTGDVSTRWYDAELSADDYAALCEGDAAGNAWLFRIDVDVPGLDHNRYLAWTGFRTFEMKASLPARDEPSRDRPRDGPAVFWSIPDVLGSRKWRRAYSDSPGVQELTLDLPDVDRWIVRLPDGDAVRLAPSQVAQRVAASIVESLAAD